MEWEEWDWEIPRTKPKRKTKSSAQARFHQRRHAQAAEDNKLNCDCPGCDQCKGFVPGCECDIRKVHIDALVPEPVERIHIHCPTHNNTHRITGCPSTTQNYPF